MTLFGDVEQAGQSEASRGRIRGAWLADGGAAAAAAAGERPAKAARSSHAMAVPPRDDSSTSWEDGAAAGTWPPRAYPCSFCRREFKSAQALGGHMNVHRRDRARLRHSSPPPSFAPLLTSPPARSLLQVPHKYSANLPAQHASEPLSPPSSQQPLALSNRSNLPSLPAPYAPFPSGCLSENGASLPLRLQQLASEAAASLLQQRSSDMLSLMPPPIADCTGLACRSSRARAPVNHKSNPLMPLPSSTSVPTPSIASSCTPLPSAADEAMRRRGFSMFEPEEERPCIENDQNHLLRQIIAGADLSGKALNAPDIRKSHIEAARDVPWMLRRKEAHAYAGGDLGAGEVDLELRLGRKPP